MTLFAGSTSSSNKIKINSIYPHSCSHSHRTNSVVLSFFHELFQPRERPRPRVDRRGSPKVQRRSGSFLRTGSILVATKPKRSDLSARETLAWSTPGSKTGGSRGFFVRPAFRFFRALAGQSSTPSITRGRRHERARDGRIFVSRRHSSSRGRGDEQSRP